MKWSRPWCPAIFAAKPRNRPSAGLPAQVTELHIHDNEPLRFKASFEVMPEIKVEGYKDLRAEKPEITVTDEEVEETLNGLREQHATFTSVEGRPLAEGDFAQASLDGKPKDDAEGQAGPHGRSSGRNRRQEHHAGVHRKPARSFRR